MIAVVPHSAPAAQQVSSSVPVNSAYAVKPGDNLWSIAEQSYGTGFKWDTIYRANSRQIRCNPNTISVGQVLAIPGAMGLWQFMPGTWPSYSSAPFSQATSWSASTPAYIKLTNQLLKWSGGNVQQALVAYNAGLGHANTILAKAG